MGIIRLLLALFVVIAHSYPLFGYLPLNPLVAVRAFFVISGFYMTLILKEKYIGKNDSYWLFLSNRLARIYPTYWLILLLTLLLSSFWFPYGKYSAFFGETKNIISLYATPHNIISDLTIIGGVNFTSIDKLTVGQAWSLAFEILFYIVAPFILKKLRVIIPVFFISIVCQYLSDHFDTANNYNLLTNMFFPSMIWFFLLGVLAYYLYKKINTMRLRHTIAMFITALFMLFTLVYAYLPIGIQIREIHLKDIAYILVLPLAIPFVFLCTSKNKFDRFLGDLSYPVYLLHTIVILVLSSNPRLTTNKDFSSVLTILFTIITSVLIVYFFEQPIEKWRQSRLAVAEVRESDGG